MPVSDEKDMIMKERPSIPVLVVEDSPICQIVVRNLLEEIGCTVTLAETVGEGFKCIKQADASGVLFQALITDYDLPDATGVDLAEAIRASNFLHKNMLIACMSALMNEERRSRCNLVGIDAAFSKPIRADDISALFKKQGVMEGAI